MKRRDVLLAAAALFVIWQIIAMIVNLPILPQPLEVLRVFVRELRRDMLIHFVVSLWRVTAGMLLSVLVAAPAGLAIGGSRRLNRFFSPFIYLLYPIPKVVLVPVVILFLGIGDTAKIAILFLILFFQILVLVRDQRSGIPPQLIQKPVGYNRDFLESYRPNVTAYLSPAERARLRDAGSPSIAPQPAGTYAKQILSRLLIDLSWNSSRLEGNTYSLLDTRRLIEFGQQPEGRQQLEAQMILNHKDAIAFLVSAAEDIGFNRYRILNLHAILANNLIADPSAPGRLRRIAVGIELSTYHPLEVPQIIEECFDHILATATAIEDPFEQAFFVMVQMPYLQPFDDVNKRVSRLAANIPFIKRNLSPLCFTDLPRDLYTQAVLGVYELNKIDLLKDVFIWAYERSADHRVWGRSHGCNLKR